jgi:hypothetical protein
MGSDKGAAIGEDKECGGICSFEGEEDKAGGDEMTWKTPVKESMRLLGCSISTLPLSSLTHPPSLPASNPFSLAIFFSVFFSILFSFCGIFKQFRTFKFVSPSNDLVST